MSLLRAVLVSPPPEDARLYPSRLLEALVEKAKSFGGRVEELGPTGIVVAFGLEPAEDAPRRAANAAMAIRKAVERGRRTDGEPVTVKLAIHVGQFLVGQASGQVRLELEGKRQAWQVLEALVARAEPDTILVCGGAVRFLERRFDLVPLGPLEGRDGQVYRLVGSERTGLGAGRWMTAFTGRHHELALLQSRFTSVLSGRGQVVGIVGEVGIGKSRLLFEFRRSLRGERITYFEGHCPSCGSAIPYLPVIGILRRNFRIGEADSPSAVMRKVRAGLRELGMDPEEWDPYLYQLFGVKEGTEPLALLSPEAIKTRTIEALRQMGFQGSRLRPIVFVVEDLQWIDRTSEECIASLVESAVGAPVLSLLTYRPGYRPPWLDKSYATQIALQPLSQPDSLRIVHSVLQTAPIPEPLTQTILHKAEGNPFFLEELSRAVGEGGDPPDILTVPDTVQEVLLARIDRLPPASKELLRTAAVLGREVSLRTCWRFCSVGRPASSDSRTHR